MNKIIFALLLFVSFDTFAQSRSQRGSTAVQKKLYCWEENGSRVCGDTLPSEASGNARLELSTKGTLRKEVDRALTPEEVNILKQQELLQQQKLKEEEAKRQQIQSLLAKYPNEERIHLDFESRINEIKTSVNILQNNQNKLKEVLIDRLTTLSELELEGKAISDKNKNDVIEIKKQMLQSDTSIASFNKKIEELTKEKEQILITFKQYKNL